MVGDLYWFHAPFRVLEATSLREFHLPQWTDKILGGYPAFSDPQFGFFFPGNLLFGLIFSSPDQQFQYNLYLLAHLIAMAFAATFLARGCGLSKVGSVFAGLVMAHNGYVVNHITQVNIIQTLIPGVFALGLLVRYLRLRGSTPFYVGLSSVLLGVAIFAGHPQTAMYLYYTYLAVAGVLSLNFAVRNGLSFRATAGQFALCLLPLLVAFGVAGVQLLPTLQLISVCDRTLMPMEAAAEFSVNLRQAAAFFFPGLFRALPWRSLTPPNFEFTYFQWVGSSALENTKHIGLAAVLLAIPSFLIRRRPLWLLLFALSLLPLLYACGMQTPVFRWAYDYLPGFKLVRAPTRALWVTFLAWGLLSGRGVDVIIKSSAAELRRAGLLTAGILAACVAGGALLMILSAYYHTGWPPTFTKVLLIDQHAMVPKVAAKLRQFDEAVRFQLLFGGAVSIACLLWALLIGRVPRKVLLPVAALLFTAEFFAYGFCREYDLKPEPSWKPESPALAAPGSDTPGRILTAEATQMGGAINGAINGGPPLANGYSVTVPVWTSAMLPQPESPWNRLHLKLLQLCNVGQVIRPLKFMKLPGDIPPFYVQERGNLALQGPPTIAVRDFSSSATLKLPQTSRVDKIHFVASATDTNGGSMNAHIATINLLGENGNVVSTSPVMLGRDIGASTGLTSKAEHQPVFAYEQTSNVHNPFAPMIIFYQAEYPINSSELVNAVRVEAVSTGPETLLLNQVILHTDSGFVALRPTESGFCNLAESRTPDWEVLTCPSLGYVWTVPTAIEMEHSDLGAVKQRIAGRDFDPFRTVLVAQGDSNARFENSKGPEDFTGTATLQLSRFPEQFHLHAQMNDNGWVVLSKTWYPGWTAEESGKAVAVRQANGNFMAVNLPPGDHNLEFRFNTPYLRTGIMLTVSSLAFCALLLLIPRARRYAGHDG
ncbi:MAG: YfhO family protein [Candidatus Sumerlaeaceae bacterium]